MHADPIVCLRPAPEAAAEFAALPYDVFDRAEAAAYVSAHPKSFLAIDRPETQFAPDHDMYAPEVYAKAGELLDARKADHTLLRDGTPAYYAWRLTMGNRSQTGIVAAVSVDEYLDGTIKRHENTRREKEEDRVRHIRALDAQTGPIFLAYRDEPTLDLIVNAACAAQPLYDFESEGSVHNTVWRIARPDAVAAIQAMFERIPAAYIADGHHRAASAVRAAQEKRVAAGKDANKSSGAAYDSFLAVLFGASQLQILPYNRVVANTNGLSVEALLGRIEQAGWKVTPADAPVEPAAKGQVGMYCSGAWYTLEIDPALVGTDPVASLDCSLLQATILEPVLGIADPTQDGRISFVGGIRGTAELERRAGADGVAFSMHATAIDELLAVADAGKLMPPKSTWFEPKLLSGLFIREL